MRAKADQLAKDARAGADKVDARLESLRQDAAKELDKAAATTQKNVNEAADKFDKGVSEVSSCLFLFVVTVGGGWCFGPWLISRVFAFRACRKRRVVFRAGSAAARRSSRVRLAMDTSL